MIATCGMSWAEVVNNLGTWLLILSPFLAVIYGVFRSDW